MTRGIATPSTLLVNEVSTLALSFASNVSIIKTTVISIVAEDGDLRNASCVGSFSFLKTEKVLNCTYNGSSPLNTSTLQI